jgi:hypothetical protein
MDSSANSLINPDARMGLAGAQAPGGAAPGAGPAAPWIWEVAASAATLPSACPA